MAETLRTLGQLADLLEITLEDEALRAKSVTGVNTLTSANDTDISFLSNPKYASQLEHTRALAVLVTPDLAEKCPAVPLVTSDPYFCFAKLTHVFDRAPSVPVGIHPSAQVDPSAQLGENCRIGANVVIGPGVTLGDDVSLGPGVVISNRAQVGAGTLLHANVTLYHDVKIGQRCIIHSGAVIGSDGFGFAPVNGKWVKIPQIGAVSIGNDVEIGANTTIDRGAVEDTVIGDGVKIDNQVQIAHNVKIGDHTAMAAMTGVAGSTEIGRHCMIGGGSGIAGHIKITDNVSLAGASAVGGDIKKPGEYGSAIPVQEKSVWQRNAIRVMHLDRLVKKMQNLERQAQDVIKLLNEETK